MGRVSWNKNVEWEIKMHEFFAIGFIVLLVVLLSASFLSWVDPRICWYKYSRPTIITLMVLFVLFAVLASIPFGV
jgi:hypothetical protein